LKNEGVAERDHFKEEGGKRRERGGKKGASLIQSSAVYSMLRRRRWENLGRAGVPEFEGGGRGEKRKKKREGRSKRTLASRRFFGPRYGIDVAFEKEGREKREGGGGGKGKDIA